MVVRGGRSSVIVGLACVFGLLAGTGASAEEAKRFRELRLRPIPLGQTLTLQLRACEAITSNEGTLKTRVFQAFGDEPERAERLSRLVDEAKPWCRGETELQPELTGLGELYAVAEFGAAARGPAARGPGAIRAATGGTGVPFADAVLEGIAAHMVEQAKAELVLSFMVAMRKDLCSAEHVHLFENACGLLRDLQTGDNLVYGSAVRAAFQQDMTDLAPRLFSSGCGRGLFTGSALQVGRALASGAPPLETIGALRDPQYLKGCEGDDVARALKRVGEVTVLLMNDGGGLIERPAPHWARRIAQRANGGEDAQGSPDEPFRIDEGQVMHLWSTLSRLQSVARGAGDRSDPSRYGAYVSSALGVFSVAADLLEREDPTARWTTALQRTEGLLGGIRNHEYGRVLTDTLWLAAHADSPVPPPVRKYGPLLSDIAAARRGEDVRAALESAAVPVGGWRRKRRLGMNTVGLGSYLGLKANAEWLGTSELARTPAASGGLAGPVGLEVSRGYGSGSVGVLVAVVDVGTLVDYRLRGEGSAESGGEGVEVQRGPSWSLEQVLSPGLFVVFGLSESFPIAAGVGGSLTPSLRTLERAPLEGSAEPRTERVSAFRAGAFVAIDLPIFQW